MATKKRIEQLESLLDWEKENGRLPKTVDLFNKQFAPTLILREVNIRTWELEAFREEGNKRASQRILIGHPSLIQLGLTILEGVQKSEARIT